MYTDGDCEPSFGSAGPVIEFVAKFSFDDVDVDADVDDDDIDDDSFTDECNRFRVLARVRPYSD